MEKLKPLAPEALYRTCEADLLPFRTTETLEPFSGFFGQERAIEAMEFGVGMRRPGYNLFVMGNPHTGRFSFAMESLRNVAKKERNRLKDWCYLNNLSDSRYPQVMEFPAGKAGQFRKDIGRMIEATLTELPAAFENPGYQRQKGRIERDFNRRYDQAIEGVERQAREHSIALFRESGTIGFMPVAEGQAMDEAAFSLLPEDVRETFSRAISQLEDCLNDSLTELPKWRREAAEQLRRLDRETALHAVAPLIQPLKEKYANVSGVPEYLTRLEVSLVRNSGEIAGDDKVLEAPDAARKAYMEDTYGVNLLVDNGKTKGAPVIHESHPNYENLFGRIEYNSDMGAMVTNFSLIRPGALHRANGGYLVLEAEKLLEQPYVYGALKRALKAHEIRIENPVSEYTGISTITLSPQPIPLKVKVVLIGGRDMYYLLQELDHDFEKMFRVVVDFDEDVERKPSSIRNYARLLKTLADEEGLAPLTRRAVARLVEHSSRLAADQELLSAHIGELVDLLCEADYKRVKTGDELISDRHVEMALAAKEKRTGRLSQKILDSIMNQTVLIDTQGEAVGKSNGLTVLQVGDVSFGTPARITATVHPGNRGIVDIEREVALGQPIHSKGVLILSGYLGHKYAQDFPLTLSASIALEQSYGYVDGDSASLAEICTLISALTHIPILQQYAITGSINQYGEVQAIGGVNEKIEGFFKLCETRGLTGQHGAVIPRANVRNLMLKKEVTDAVSEGKFHIFAVDTVDQCLEVLMGRSAGKSKPDRSFTQRSVNHAVTKRLREIAAAKASSSSSSSSS
jgi:predicted ATP-dependent protease